MKISNAIKGVVAASSLLSLGVDAFWRLPCQGQLALERVDPIDTPGTIAKHVHTIHGAYNFAKHSSCDDLRQSSCSSCSVKQDMSAYWTPNLYFQYPDGELVALNQTGGMLVYYLLRGENIKPFPENFHAIAGQSFTRNYTWPDVEQSLWDSHGLTTNQKFLAQQAVGYNCLNYDEPAKAALGLRRIPDNWRDCKDGLRAEVFFQSCWDGINSDSEDHRKHLAYPTFMSDGECPKSHPVRLPSLFFETIWNVGQAAQLDAAWNAKHGNKYGKKGRLVFSNGDATGLGYHGDFMNGWQTDVLKAAIRDCTDPSGVVEKCQHFDFWTRDEIASCIKPVEVKENVWGPMKRLPGCNDVSDSPHDEEKESSCQYDGAADDDEKPKAIKPAKLSYDVDVPVTRKVAKQHAPKAAKYNSPSPKAAPAPTYNDVPVVEPQAKRPKITSETYSTMQKPETEDCDDPKKKKKNVHVKLETKVVTEVHYKYMKKPNSHRHNRRHGRMY